jgi:integrase
MSVHRQPNASSWSVKWRINGQSKTKSFSDKKFGGKAEAKAQAEAFDTQLKADILRNEYYDPQKNKISLSDFKHEVGLTKAVHKESSKQSLEHTWESRVAPYPIADKSIASIGANDIAIHLRDLRKPNGEEYSRSALNKTLEVIRVLLDQAYEMDLIKKNPAKTKLAKKYLPKKDRPKHIYLNPFQINALTKEIEKTHPIYSAMIPLMAYTGLRSGEVRALTWEDIDFSNGTLRINKSVNDNQDMKISDPKTEGSSRTIQLDSITLKRMSEHREKLPVDCELVFPNMRGNQNGSEILCTNPIRARNFKRRVLQPAVKKLGLPEEVNLHTFRHTSVFLGVLSGSDILAISKRLGHKSIRITADTYSDLFKETDIELADKLADLQVKTLDQEFPETKEQLG